MSRKKKNRNQAPSSQKIILITVIIQLVERVFSLIEKLIDRLIE